MITNQNSPAYILIVDDIPENLRLLATLLTQRGYKVRPAPSGAHALATIKKEHPDLILLDIMLQDMNGFEVCHTLKANSQTTDIPVIFLSAIDELESKVMGFEVGGVDYITKPFQEREVIQRVETHLKIQRLQQDLRSESARFKTLTEATSEAIIIHQDDTIIDVNPATVKLFNSQDSQLIGTSLNSYISLPELQKLSSDNTLQIEISVNRVDKSHFPAEVRTKIMPLKNKNYSVTAIRDLTYQKTTEKEKNKLIQENTALKATVKDIFKFGDIIGRSKAMQEVYELISKASSSMYPVVISGESGTGKELTATTIHQLQFGAKLPFITVNCGAITESLFEREFFGHRKGSFTDAVQDQPGFLDAANEGTLFLDEIGELPLTMQVKLLRVLENGEYTPVGDTRSKRSEIRIIAATNRNLQELVRQGSFREDLYYRIQVIQITLPPLRKRLEDILLLAEHFLEKNSENKRVVDLPEKLQQMFFHYDWPGNVRELLNTLQRYLATDIVTLLGSKESDSKSISTMDGGLNKALETLEKKILKETLHKNLWHREKTAKELHIPRRSLLRKINKYNLTKTGQ